MSSIRRFRDWRDFVLTPVIEILLIGMALCGAAVLKRQMGIGWLESAFVFYLALVVASLFLLKILRLCFSLKRGIYSYETKPWVFYGWKLHRFLCMTNLSFQYMNGLLPPIFRTAFYWLLGANVGGAGVRISGRLLDPYLISLGPSVSIGDDALLIPHNYAVGSSDLLTLEKIELKEGAVVGARSTLLPGVVLGENAMVKSMSIVPMNTKIPAKEIWGGIPAAKMADMDKPLTEGL